MRASPGRIKLTAFVIANSQLPVARIPRPAVAMAKVQIIVADQALLPVAIAGPIWLGYSFIGYRLSLPRRLFFWRFTARAARASADL